MKISELGIYIFARPSDVPYTCYLEWEGRACERLARGRGGAGFRIRIRIQSGHWIRTTALALHSYIEVVVVKFVLYDPV